MKFRIFGLVATTTLLASSQVVQQSAQNTSAKLPLGGAPSYVTAKENLTPEQKENRRKSFAKAIYKHTGGQVSVPDSGKGRIVYVNATAKRIPNQWLEDVAKDFGKLTRVRIDVEEGIFAFPKPTLAGDATLFVIDDANMPAILSAPEDRWCAINISHLSQGAGEKAAYFSARVRKELTRGFALLAGAQASNYPDSLLGSVTKPEHLDQFMDCRLPIDIQARFVPYLKGYGITPKRVVYYKKACEEGWAPAPTNDVQKAIWEKVRASPKNPMKIEFDPKKGR